MRNFVFGLVSVLVLSLFENTLAFQGLPVLPTSRPKQCPVIQSSYTVLPHRSLPQRVQKHDVSSASKNVKRAHNLARTVASIKQQISRRDFHKVLATRVASSTAMLCPLLSWLPTPRAYAEEPAAAADKCPNLQELGKKSRPADFTEKKYEGVWYEIAYHDVTQANFFCACTRFNFTIRSANFIEDMFTTTCGPPTLPAVGNVYTLNMTIGFDKAKPGEFTERGFAINFPNVVLYVWKKTSPKGEMYYDRSLQMQCVESGGRILFTGINFLARSNKISDAELNEMFTKAAELGIDAYGGDRAGMYMVQHSGCKYPLSTDASVLGDRSDFPGPLLNPGELYTYPDPRVDVYA